MTSCPTAPCWRWNWLIDAVIRCFDMAGGLQLDLAGAIAEKLAYNAGRADHKIENRAAEGGKKF